MVFRLGLALDPDEFAAFDEKALAGAEAGEEKFDAEGFDDVASGVGDEREGVVVFGVEFFLGGGFVHADTDDFDALCGEFGDIVLQTAGLGGSPAGAGFGVEEDECGALFVKVGRGDGVAVLVTGLEGGCGVPGMQGFVCGVGGHGEGESGCGEGEESTYHGAIVAWVGGGCE